MSTVTLPRQNITLALEDRGQGRPVVWLHAFPLDRGMWEPQLQPLLAAGYRVITVDLPGFGESPVQAGWTIDSAADALAELLEVLQVPAAVVGGESMGGYVALALARRHPHSLSGLILADTRAGSDDAAARARRQETIEAIRQKGPAALLETLVPKLISDATRQSRPHVLETIRTLTLRQTTQGLIDALIALRDRPDAAPYLPNIRVPTLVIVGEYDTITPPLYAARLAGLIDSAELVHIPQAGHLSNLENPEAFNAAVLSFLQRRIS
ncbi:MAG: alpha/beta fold hydrolase [Thermogemmata sp.]|uniref:Alpha/beta fold hydrolase n=1 Tax=Thermogemmata fonticola TaxID=2755323 RepID=A0A7V9AAC7_9BACT|nr:alpha/beta fold hydrolase [Thermogemmata fonticola]MBA2224769.1 alpha/beta fold hydrolase [Thermogemmata fonticola]MCX8140193.1 alpha/beta hydrolase [Gemmataceae bacterium]GIW84677.1 MAG: alpha/beta hydrolase [Gemmataceae bacterium]